MSQGSVNWFLTLLGKINFTGSEITAGANINVHISPIWKQHGRHSSEF